MEDFIVFDNVYGKKNAVRKSAIISIYEEENEDGVVCVSTNNSDFEIPATFDSIISKL
nr:MAG TPA: hypothetical protein [Caudoviricetes sp.]